MKLHHVHEMHSTEVDTPTIYGLLPDRGLVGLVGAAGACKSTFLQQLLAALVYNRPFIGRDQWLDGISAAYIAVEGADETRRNLFAQSVCTGELILPGPYDRADIERRNPDGNLSVLAGDLDLFDRGQRQALIRQLRDGGYTVAALDTLARAMPGRSDSNPGDMSGAVKWFEEIRCEGLDNGLLLVAHHMGKDESRGSRGATQFPCAVDLELHLSKRRGGLRLWVEKCRFARDQYAIDLAIEEHSVVIDAGFEMRSGEIVPPTTRLFREIVAGAPMASRDTPRGLPAVVFGALSPRLAKGPISTADARTIAYSCMGDVDPRYRSSRFATALRSLAEHGYLTVDGGMVSAPVAPTAPNPLHIGGVSVPVFGAPQACTEITEIAPKSALSVQ